MPFGGRGDDIAWLNRWLEDEHSPRSLLLWGPAGRGKSALVVRWIEQLPADVARAFVPISIRAATNSPGMFYPALASRLGTILQKTPPSPSVDPIASARERVLEYFREFTDPARPCVVVIDGLDEAAGWELDESILPADPPPGLRIVVSARQLAGDDGGKDWLRRLGWNSSQADAQAREVRPLSREGTADVLLRMGDPLAHLVDKESVVDELYRLSDQGDPLLLSLYVEDLSKSPEEAAHIRPEDLRARKPGFEDFFRNWYEQQQRAWRTFPQPPDPNLIDTILATLACAMGPLLLSDISALLDRILPVRVAAATLTTLKPLERFIIGHAGRWDAQWAGSADAGGQGFVLSHPRLADYFREDYFANTSLIPAVEAAFRDWGRSAAHREPGQPGTEVAVPRYVLLYYLQHLQKDPATPLARYRELAEDRWRLAWRAAEGGYGTFAAQMGICWRRLYDAHRADPAIMIEPYTGLAGLIHIGLCISSVRSIGTNIPPNFIAEMVRQGFLTAREAILMARNRDNVYLRGAILTALAGAADPVPANLDALVAESEEIPEARIFTNILLAVAKRSERNSAGEVLRRLVERLSQSKEADFDKKFFLGKILRTAQSFDAQLLQALFDFARTQFDSKDVPEPSSVREARGEIPEKPVRTLPERYPPDPDFTPRRFAARIRVNREAATAEVAQAIRRLEGVGADAVTRENLEAAMVLLFEEQSYSLPAKLARLAAHMPADMLPGAIRRILSLPYGYQAREAMEAVLPYLDGEARLAAVPLILDQADGSNISFTSRDALVAVLSVLSPDEMRRTVPLLDAIESPYDKTEIFQEIHDRLDPHSLASIVKVAQLPVSDEWRVQSSRDGIIGVVRGDLDEAQKRDLLVTALSESPRPRPELLNQIAPAFSPELLREAVGQALLARLGYRAALLTPLIAPVAAEAPDQLEIILRASEALDDTAERLKLIDLVLPHLDPARRREVLAEVRGVAIEIGDRPIVALALAALGEIPNLAQTGRTDLWSLLHNDAKVNFVAAISLGFIALLPDIPTDVAVTALDQARRRAGSLDPEQRLVVGMLAATCPRLNDSLGESALAEVVSLCEDEAFDSNFRAIVNAMVVLSPYLRKTSLDARVRKARADLRDEKLQRDTRWVIASILAGAPRVGASATADGIQVLKAAISDSEGEGIDRHSLAFFLALSSHVTQADLDGLPPLEEAPEDRVGRNFGGEVLFRFGLLGYREDERNSPIVAELVSRLADLERLDALSLLALVEGRWGETLELKPGISGGAPPTRVLERWGGADAAREIAAGIRQVASWWP